uniref:Uncharacterized protein n=1 Tax=Myotis myotis TaxID=51298 RepID=A0A7J7RH86_MYOMY|nr:hypothetical protein mMyoMyo1_010333 [Myotis myotis]
MGLVFLSPWSLHSTLQLPRSPWPLGLPRAWAPAAPASPSLPSVPLPCRDLGGCKRVPLIALHPPLATKGPPRPTSAPHSPGQAFRLGSPALPREQGSPGEARGVGWWASPPQRAPGTGDAGPDGQLSPLAECHSASLSLAYRPALPQPHPRCSGPPWRAVRPQERRAGLPPGSTQAALRKPGSQGQGGGLVHAPPSGLLPGPGASCSGCGLQGRGGRPQSGVGCWTLPLDLSPGLGKDPQDRRGHARHRSRRQERLRKEASAPGSRRDAPFFVQRCRGLGPQAWHPPPLQCGHTASGRPEERGQSGDGEQRRGASCAGVAVRGRVGVCPSGSNIA